MPALAAGSTTASIAIDNRFNTVPSFHVIYTASILLAFIDVATPAAAPARLAPGWSWSARRPCSPTAITSLDVAAGLARSRSRCGRCLLRPRAGEPAFVHAPRDVQMNGVGAHEARSLFAAALLRAARRERGAGAGRRRRPPITRRLRKLKTDVVNAINARNLDGIDVLLHKPFLATMITQDSFNDAGKLKAWFEDLFTRHFLRIASIQMEAEADETAQIYTGTFAVARGSTKERYELGRRPRLRHRRPMDRDGASRRTGSGRCLPSTAAPTSSTIRCSTRSSAHSLTFAAGAAAVGVVIGFLVGFFVRRRRAKPA